MVLHVKVGRRTTTVELEWLDTSLDPPRSLVATEIVLFVQLARMATRTRICPVAVKSSHELEPRDAYTEYFGVRPRRGAGPFISFDCEDSARPFVTANEAMWKTFEPTLRERLSELDESATTVDRVRAALLGTPSVAAVSQRLGTSKRTLQRRLGREARSFQEVLNDTREDLARHYLRNTRLTGAEISFLLGFEDPNSFFRAFHTWTGETPAEVRGALRG